MAKSLFDKMIEQGALVATRELTRKGIREWIPKIKDALNKDKGRKTEKFDDDEEDSTEA